ncbi:MAG: TPM domain-containing protein [Chitinophagaceae bacterium]|nr:TPM domain-containing protein [Chitinophagaceae bacterium]
MKRILAILTLFISFCATAQIDKVIPKRPSPPKLVNDFTGTLTPEQAIALERKLVAFDDSTSNQIAIVLITTTEGSSIEDVAIELGRAWGVGNTEKNNGIVLLVAKGDRKTTIQVGYGLEGAIPDVTAKSIIDHEIIPNFKQDNYYRGLDEAADALIKAAAGEYKAPEGYGSKKKGGFKTWMIIAIVLFIILSSMFGGTSGGTYVSRGGYRGWGGGGWSGGGGSSGGGGFGGFGGGSFGGGGASGSW